MLLLPLLPFIALEIYAILVVAKYLVRILTDKQPSFFIRALAGQERLSVVFWKYGIVGYPTFAIAVFVIVGADENFFFNIQGLGGEWQFFSIKKAETAWYLLTLYKLLWVSAIYRCCENTDQAIAKYTVIGITFLVIFTYSKQLTLIMNMPTQNEAYESCLIESSFQKRVRELAQRLEKQSSQPNFNIRKFEMAWQSHEKFAITQCFKRIADPYLPKGI